MGVSLYKLPEKSNPFDISIVNIVKWIPTGKPVSPLPKIQASLGLRHIFALDSVG